MYAVFNSVWINSGLSNWWSEGLICSLQAPSDHCYFPAFLLLWKAWFSESLLSSLASVCCPFSWGFGGLGRGLCSLCFVRGQVEVPAAFSARTAEGGRLVCSCIQGKLGCLCCLHSQETSGQFDSFWRILKFQKVARYRREDFVIQAPAELSLVKFFF